MERIKVGHLVRIHNSTEQSNGRIVAVRHANTPGNKYIVGNSLNSVFNPFTYIVSFTVTRGQMTVLTPEEYPELYI